MRSLATPLSLSNGSAVKRLVPPRGAAFVTSAAHAMATPACLDAIDWPSVTATTAAAALAAPSGDGSRHGAGGALGAKVALKPAGLPSEVVKRT